MLQFSSLYHSLFSATVRFFRTKSLVWWSNDWEVIHLHCSSLNIKTLILQRQFSSNRGIPESSQVIFLASFWNSSFRQVFETTPLNHVCIVMFMPLFCVLWFNFIFINHILKGFTSSQQSRKLESTYYGCGTKQFHNQ